MSQGHVGKRLEGIKSNYSLIWLLHLKIKNGFYKYMVGKRRLKEYLHHLLIAEGVVVKGMRNDRGT